MAEAKSIKFISMYVVHGDGGNEYSRGPVIGIFETKEEADLYSKGKGWYGSDGHTSAVPAVSITWERDRIDLYVLQSNWPVKLTKHTELYERELYEKVIKSLSPEELRVLNKLHICQTSKT
jgi:hypothetical protein